MARAAVLLDLARWILGTLGSSTTEMSLLSSRQPVWVALLVLSSPAMNSIEIFEHHISIEEYSPYIQGTRTGSSPISHDLPPLQASS